MLASANQHRLVKTEQPSSTSSFYPKMGAKVCFEKIVQNNASIAKKLSKNVVKKVVATPF